MSLLHHWSMPPNLQSMSLSCVPVQQVNTVIRFNQGRIEPPKAARGHATYIDGKMLSVTKYSFQIYFRFHTCNDASTIANRWKWLISRPSVRLRRRLSLPAGSRRSLGYRRYFTAIENDRVSIRRAVVESGECSSCFRRYFR